MEFGIEPEAIIALLARLGTSDPVDPALDADARHLVTDVWTSGGVVLGIGLVQLTGWLWLDPLVAVGVALNILKEGER